MYYWYVQNKELFSELKKSIDDNYATLNVIVENNIVFLRGTLRLKDKSGREIDNYLIEVEIPPNYPSEAPKVREKGGKIPKENYRHINKDGVACLYFRDETSKYWNENSTIIDFMKNVVEKFFLWQTEYGLTGGKNSGESWGHGSTNAALEFYGNILGTKDRKIIYKFIEYLSKKKIKSHWLCFCGNGKKLKECHLYLVNEYKKKIRRKDVQKTLGEIKAEGKVNL